MNLSPITAYFRDSAGQAQKVSPANALMADDLAGAWESWRQDAASSKGWELFISPPSSGDYTRAIFRTPADVQYLLDNGQATAASVDSSAHQAGRAVDLDLAGMAAAFPNYDYGQLVAMAARHGFKNRVYLLNGSEPWHFDDDPVGRGIFATMRDAVDAIGNTSAQVAAAVAAGLDTPQIAALRAAIFSPAGAMLGLALVIGIGAAVAIKRRRMWADGND